MSALLDRIRVALAAVRDPQRAIGAQRYMKSAMPYYGIPTPLFRRTLAPILLEYSVTTRAAWKKDVLAVWRDASYREERYAAIELTGIKAARPFQTMASLSMYERMIVEGAWWDYVDTIASHRLGDILRAEPREMKKAMRGWSRDHDMWKRRSSILCQLGMKGDTDLKLLYDCIEPSLGSKEFFLRKAIGWALRQYAWTDPREVRRYVKAHEASLSALSKREALKNI